MARLWLGSDAMVCGGRGRAGPQEDLRGTYEDARGDHTLYATWTGLTVTLFLLSYMDLCTAQTNLVKPSLVSQATWVLLDVSALCPSQA